MVKHSREKLLTALTVAFLSVSSPLALTGNSWAQKPTDPQIKSLIEKLKSNDEVERENIVNDLEKIGKPAIPRLIESLKDENLLVRQGTAEALGGIGKPAVPALRKAMKDSNKYVRRSAVSALGWSRMGAEAKAAMPELRTALKDPDENVRSSAASALGNMGAEAKAAVPELKAALKDSDKDVRRSAAYALGNMGAEAKAAVPELKAALKDSDKDVRRWAAYALGQIGAEAKAAVPELKAALQDSDKDVRRWAAYALGQIGAEAKAAVPELKAALKDKEIYVRSWAATALGNIGAEAKAAVPELKAALQDPDKDVRSWAATALGNIGAEAKAAVPELKAALKDADKDVRSSAASALGSIAVKLQDKAKANTLPFSDLNQAIADLEPALKILEDPKVKFTPDEIANLRRPLEALKDKRNDYLFIKGILTNPWLWGGGIYLVSFLGIFWLRPVWLLKIDDLLKPIGFKLPVVGAEITPRILLFLKHHPRVLDAWVAAHLNSVCEEFQEKDTVRDRKVYISNPVILDGKTVPQLTGKDLRSTFKKQRGCLLIWGEGGAGKTSLACQIAKWAISEDENERLCKHRMLPILIEEELDSDMAAGKPPFLAAIQGQLQDLTNEKQPISEELLEQLLRQQRILVIVDHFSEMSEATRKAIRPESPDFSVNALVITSRTEESLGKVTKNTLTPRRIQGNRLSSFMEAYLTQRGKRDSFTDREFFDACGRLSEMVDKREITVLLAKLYAEQLIVEKEDPSPDKLPNNIPDLMLSYLNELNRNVTGDKFDDRTVHEDAKTLAWECLKQTFRPTSANRKDAITALTGDNAEARLKYLETRLRIILTVNPGQDKIRFSLDPVAEYFAGLYLLDTYGQDAQKWRDFLLQAKAMPGAPELIKGFLLAVRDCCLAKGKEAQIPDFVADELDKLAGLSPTPQPQIQQIPAVSFS